MLQDLELDLWPEKESEDLKCAGTDWQESPKIGAVLVRRVEDGSEQAGLSSRKNGSGDRPKFLGIVNVAIARAVISEGANERPLGKGRGLDNQKTYHCANFAGYRPGVADRIIIVYPFNIIFIWMKRLERVRVVMTAIKRERMVAVGSRLAVKPKSQ